MGKDQIYKDEAGELLDQHAHVVATTQDLRQSTRKIVRLTKITLERKVPSQEQCQQGIITLIALSVNTTRHLQDTVSLGFGSIIVDQIHKRVQVLLQSCNTTSLEDVERGSLAELESCRYR